jgi:hypothetical protein
MIRYYYTLPRFLYCVWRNTEHGVRVCNSALIIFINYVRKHILYNSWHTGKVLKYRNRTAFSKCFTYTLDLSYNGIMYIVHASVWRKQEQSVYTYECNSYLAVLYRSISFTRYCVRILYNPNKHVAYTHRYVVHTKFYFLEIIIRMYVCNAGKVYTWCST